MIVLMDEQERLKELIEKPKQPNVSEWVYEVESFLEESGEGDSEAWVLIDRIKLQGDAFQYCSNLVALLKQIYKKKYNNVKAPQVMKKKQIFIAMMFSDATNGTYENAYKATMHKLGYDVMRIDEKEFTGSIIGEITTEIQNSIALIADLTGNRGGVYYEAGIARGLQLCNHPIKLILTCQQDFFVNEKVHFDVSGDNIILYKNDEELKEKLEKRLTSVLQNVSNI